MLHAVCHCDAEGVAPVGGNDWAGILAVDGIDHSFVAIGSERGVGNVERVLCLLAVLVKGLA